MIRVEILANDIKQRTVIVDINGEKNHPTVNRGIKIILCISIYCQLRKNIKN